MEVVRRTEPELAGRFAKDPLDEDFLARLNAALAPAARADELDLDEAYPTLHVIGVPRSGTTLLYQVAAAGLELGYVNNLTAAFWLAPSYGLRLSRKLGLDRPGARFDSAFGRTAGPAEPHEFGYFWNHHLRDPDLCERPPGHEREIDWDGLRRAIVNMAHWQGGPMAFKPMLLVWHLEAMLERMPRTCYVWIRRPPRETALSLLGMRRSLFGSLETWASLRPGGPGWLDGEPPWRQVAAQVLELERAIAGAAARMGPEHVLELRYEELCAAPGEALERIRALLGTKGHAPARRDVELDRFEQRGSDELEGELGTLVDEALADLGSGP
ncbi:MAG: sulfotransferase [Thermoleophilia bacterium]|nr:sulfotransferase [Thermoleophilia bacterium]